MNTSTITAFVLCTALVAGTAFSSCNQNIMGGKPPKGEKTLRLPCAGPASMSDKKFLRANSVGESMDQVTSRKKALANAKNELASSIHGTVKVVADNFIESSEFDNREVLLEKFVELTRIVVNQELSGVSTSCQQVVRTKQNTYKTYVCIEVPSEELLAELHERISRSEELKLDYKYEQFKNDFEKEMERLEKERSW